MGDVVGEVAESEGGAAEVFESAVDGFGRAVAGARAVEVGQLSSLDRLLVVAERPAEGKRARCQAQGVNFMAIIVRRCGARFHIAQTRDLGGYLCGRRLYETMLLWETDPSLRDNELGAAFADVWCAIPKVVFSRTLDSVQATPGSPRRRWPRRPLRRATRPTRTSRSAVVLSDDELRRLLDAAKGTDFGAHRDTASLRRSSTPGSGSTRSLHSPSTASASTWMCCGYSASRGHHRRCVELVDTRSGVG